MSPFTQTLLRRAAAWLLVALVCAAPLHAADRKPNFLFIYTDDQRWDAMGVVQREQGERARFPWFKTPNMDRLAAGGRAFPQRLRHPLALRPEPRRVPDGALQPPQWRDQQPHAFPEDSVTHATQLRAAGYKTAYIGKWHMGNQRGQRPGFDYSASFVGHGRYHDCPFEINGVSAPTKGWVDDVSTDFAIDWMKQNRERAVLDGRRFQESAQPARRREPPRAPALPVRR